MIKHTRLFVALAALALFAATHANRISFAARPARQPAAAETRRALTPEEARGKALYLRGESAAGREVTATVGEVDVPATALTCAGCHGLRGEGKTEGGVTAGSLTWSSLLTPHTHPTGRRHTAYDPASFAKAMRAGTDPSGNVMLAAMPRYRISPEDLADLVAYLKRIETDTDPGLTATEIAVGTILPEQGALATTGAAMRDVLTAYFEEVNGKGGIYGRRLALNVVGQGADAAATAAAARRAIDEGRAFAFVGGISAGADRELSARARETGTPFVGPSTLLTQTGTPLNRQVFYLLPGLGEQARALVNFAATGLTQKPSRVLVVHAGGEVAESAAAAAEDQARRAGVATVVREQFARGALDARQVVQKLKGANTDALFFFGAGGEEASVLREAAAAGWTPNVFLLGALTGRDLVASVTPDFKDRVFVAFPTVPSDITPSGLAELRALQEKYKFAARHTASQLAALAAAKVFVEALSRAGRDLSREQLIAALEGFYEYETGLTPRLTFGPNRRVGAAGANVVKIDPDKKEFAPAAGWVKAN